MQLSSATDYPLFIFLQKEEKSNITPLTHTQELAIYYRLLALNST